MANLADEVSKAAAQSARTSNSVPVQVLSLTIQLVAAWRASKDSDYMAAAKRLTELNLLYKHDPVVCVSMKLGPIASTQLSAALNKEGVEHFKLARGLVGVRKRDLERVHEIAEKAGVKLPSMSFTEKELAAAAPEAAEVARAAQEKTGAEKGEEKGGGPEQAAYEPNEKDGGFNPPIAEQERCAAYAARVYEKIGLEQGGLEQTEPMR